MKPTQSHECLLRAPFSMDAALRAAQRHACRAADCRRRGRGFPNNARRS
ncbi:hypothetical protein C7S16_7214 [Burkholderia thailandensis]|uniref:Uncharacterized protein n=1 Tax=Burkholderia thailandensis TaxID=57975 RepID=A0AAW9CMU8_BURTH|nr:hypothetical protein [Burkholderia thailandensis]MDW9251472.1 hypothetical protein [Burkholderia thailandensis]